MREIVHIQVGQCGNQIGTQFWESISLEHGIGEDGLHDGVKVEGLIRADVYWNKTSSNRFVPRGVVVDLEPGTINSVKADPWGKMFNPDNFVHGQSGAGNNWAKGHYTEGAEISDEVVDVIRQEVERCECLQGFQFVHSLGGGTGSGLGTLLLAKMMEEFPDQINTAFSVFPSDLVSDVVVEPYNALFAVHSLLNDAGQCFVLDNRALYHICQNEFKIQSPTYKDLNRAVCRTMTGVTTCFRFPGQLNADLRKLATNMIPFPRLKFFIPGYSPLNTSSQRYSKTNIVTELFTPKNMLAACNPRRGKYLTCACIFRGANLSMREIDTQLNQIQLKDGAYFAEWIPNNIKTAVCNVPPAESEESGTFMGNNTAIQDIFTRIVEQYRKMYSKRAFAHWYFNEGMDEMEFSEAEANIVDMLDEYQMYENADGLDFDDDDINEYEPQEYESY